MNVRQLLVVGAAALGAWSPLPPAAQSLKPGLWQITHQTQGSGDMAQAMADMQKQMANMPPEQRKLVQEHMARQGVQVGSAPAGGGMALKVCMTPEMAQRGQVPSQRSDCSTTAQARSGNTTKIAFACTNPPSKGEGEVTFQSPEAYTSRITVATTMQGRQQQVTMSSQGKWLSADCGSVKPLAPTRR
jgi:hypothetical protein